MRTFFAAVFFLLASGMATAIPGRFDSAFNGGEFVEVGAGGFSTELPRAIEQQADGKFLVAGHTDGRGFVARVNPDGTLDATFGTNGLWLDPDEIPGTRWVGAYGTGTIVVAVNHRSTAFVYVLSANGSIADRFSIFPPTCVTWPCGATLGTGAVDRATGRAWIGSSAIDGPTVDSTARDFLVTTLSPEGALARYDRYDFGYAESLQAIAPDPVGGGVVMAGTAIRTGEAPAVIVARALANGSLDASFGQGGGVVLPYSEADDSVVSILANAGGYLVATRRGTVIRLTDAGAIDTAFGSGGRITGILAGASGGSIARLLAPIDVFKRFLVAGDTQDGGFAFVRMFPNGSVDPSFASGGRTGPTYPRGALVDAVLLPGNGVMAVGTVDPGGSQFDMALARYSSSGALDSGFGVGGRFARDFGLRNGTRGLRVGQQSNGVIVAAGTARFGADQGLVLTELGETGLPYVGFNPSPVVLHLPGKSIHLAAMWVMLENDRIVVAGHIAATDATIRSLFVARFTSGGSLDISFGAGGFLLLPDTCDAANDESYLANCRVMLQQSDAGKVLLAAAVNPEDPARASIAVYRIAANGTVDASFGGVAGARFSSGESVVPGGVFQRFDGSVVLVAGSGSAGDVQKRVVFARYGITGSPDPAFGTSGRVATTLRLGSLQSFRHYDNSLFVAGYGGDGRLVIARYSDSGAPIEDFGNAGSIVATIEAGSHVVNQLMVGNDGRIYAVGHVEVPGYARAPYVARFTPNGIFDKTYADGGVSRYNTTSAHAMGALVDHSGRVVVTGWDDSPWYHDDDTMQVTRLMGGSGSKRDFVGFGTDAVVWLDPSTGMATASYLGSTKGLYLQSPDEIAPIVADLDGDARAEFVRQTSAGLVQRMTVDVNWGRSIETIASGAAGWRVTHAGDLDGDGKDDLAWVGPGGTIRLSTMDGARATASVDLDWPGWRVDALADMDGDGRADLVITHDAGYLAVVLMRGLQPVAIGLVLDAGSGWHFVAAADLTANGKADLIVSHADGSMLALAMEGVTPIAGWGLAAPGLGAEYKGVVDLTPNSTYVIVRRGDGSWHLVDGSPYAGRDYTIFGAGSEWSITHVMYLDRDEMGDLVMRHTDGTIGAWMSRTGTFQTLKGPGPEVVIP